MGDPNKNKPVVQVKDTKYLCINISSEVPTGTPVSD